MQAQQSPEPDNTEECAEAAEESAGSPERAGIVDYRAGRRPPSLVEDANRLAHLVAEDEAALGIGNPLAGNAGEIDLRMRTTGIQGADRPLGFLRSTQEMVPLDGLETAGEQETESEQGKKGSVKKSADTRTGRGRHEPCRLNHP